MVQPIAQVMDLRNQEEKVFNPIPFGSGSQEHELLRAIVSGVYDFQKLRIQTGNRIVAIFRARLGIQPGQEEDEEAKKALDVIRKEYNRITDGIIEIGDQISADFDTAISEADLPRIAGNTLTEKKFSKVVKELKQCVFNSYTEYLLVQKYMELLRDEERSFRQLTNFLEGFSIYPWLKSVKGIGPAMAAVIISGFDIREARYASSLWKYAGLDVVNVGTTDEPKWEGRRNHGPHLIDVLYIDREGNEATRKSLSHNRFMKTKLLGVLAGCLLRAKNPEYTQVYSDYRNRLENRPDLKDHTKGHKNRMALRYMIKRFLVELYYRWREAEGLPVHREYAEAKLGLVHKK